MANVYLDKLVEKYEGLQKSIEGLQTRAAEANNGAGRELSTDERTLVRSQGDEAKKLAEEITELTEIENRNLKVSKLHADLAAATGAAIAGDDDKDDAGGKSGGSADQTRSTRLAGGATTKDRDPGHYTRSSQYSLFGDLYKSKVLDDDAAQRRLSEHNRALTTGAHGPGIVPPKWLTEEYEALARQGRSLANAVRNIPLGDDPRPITLPKQIAGTDAVVAEQAAENNPVGGADAFDTDVDTVVPRPTAGKQTVSRQMVDMASPAIDLLIYGDLMSVYNLKVENKVGAAVLAGGPAPLTGTAANFSTLTAATSGPDQALKAAIAVRKARKLPANILAMTIDRYGEFLALKDTQGRPVMPDDSAGPMNVVGVGSVQVDGRLKAMGVVATDAMGTGALPDTFAALRASDVLLFESSVLRFRFEEVAGPESIVLGIWAYTGVIARQSGKCIQRVNVTAA